MTKSTLTLRIRKKDPSVKGAIKDSTHPTYWILPNAIAQKIISEGKKVQRLRASGWIGTGEITKIEGAVKPVTYIARAARYFKEHGKSPPWAQKVGDRWVFKRSHIDTEAEFNRSHLTSEQIAKKFKVSRRTAINWIDRGLFGEVVQRGQLGARRVTREGFRMGLPEAYERLERLAAVASRTRRKKPVGKGPEREKSGPIERRTPEQIAGDIFENIRVDVGRGVLSPSDARRLMQQYGHKNELPEKLIQRYLMRLRSR